MLVSNVAFLIVVYLLVFLIMGVVFAVGISIGYKIREKQMKPRKWRFCKRNEKS